MFQSLTSEEAEILLAKLGSGYDKSKYVSKSCAIESRRTTSEALLTSYRHVRFVNAAIRTEITAIRWQIRREVTV